MKAVKSRGSEIKAKI